MHVPDGYINAATSLGAGVVAAGGLTLALRKTGDWLDDRRVPLTGLAAAFIFVAQMLNFPVAAGTSGHLIGGVLAAILVGPWTGALCIAVVLVMQALFADGGLTAIGLNIVNLSLVATLGGYATFLGLRRILPTGRKSIVFATGVAAGASVMLSALAFTLEFALGGNVPVATSTVATAMISVHAMIGIGEAFISAATIGMILGVRPDLVYGAQDLPLLSPVTSEPALAGTRG